MFAAVLSRKRQLRTRQGRQCARADPWELPYPGWNVVAEALLDGYLLIDRSISTCVSTYARCHGRLVLGRVRVTA
jgi:hypothetical protein